VVKKHWLIFLKAQSAHRATFYAWSGMERRLCRLFFWRRSCAGALVHLNNHDVSYVAVSRAPIEEIEAFKKRMGWTFKWVSSFNNDFNFDFHVSFRPEDIIDGEVDYNYQKIPYLSEELSGDSAFYKDEDGNIFHTYSPMPVAVNQSLPLICCWIWHPKVVMKADPVT
jgi:predicted dithiol-disulfide oxidoreductase (DUF899 family)